MFPRSRQLLRCWATRVLLVWVLGLVAGVANACVAGVQSGGDTVAQAWSRAAHDEPSHTHRVDTCNQSSIAAPVPAAKLSLDNLFAGSLPAMAVDPVMTPTAPVSHRAMAVASERRGEPSIPIAFLRLTL